MRPRCRCSRLIGTMSPLEGPPPQRVRSGGGARNALSGLHPIAMEAHVRGRPSQLACSNGSFVVSEAKASDLQLGGLTPSSPLNAL